jgi:predicted membrane protein
MDNSNVRISPRLIVGIFIVLIGVVFLLEEFMGIDAQQILAYWPVGLIILGLLGLIQGTSKVGAVVALIVGVWALAWNLGYVSVEIWQFWPLAIVAVGLSLVKRALTGQKPPAAGAVGEPNDRVNAFAIMGGVVRTNNSSAFRGGEMSAIMGGCELDLTQAQLADGEAVIDVFALWGGIEIRIPDTWGVSGQVQPIMGAFEDKTRPPRDAKTRLIVRGVVIMGGVEVKN